MKKKDAKYTFNVNREEREKFKMYCKLMKVSPSALLGEVVANFNSDIDKILSMKNSSELQDMLEGKFSLASDQFDVAVSHSVIKE